MATNDIRSLFTLLGQYDLFGVDGEAEEVFEHREAEDVFKYLEAEEVFEHREAEEVLEHRKAEEVFEHRTYVLWKLRSDDELLFNSSIFEEITWHNTDR